MEIIFIECAYEFFESLFNRLQIDLIAILFVRIKIVREKDSSIVKTFHFSVIFLKFRAKYFNSIIYSTFKELKSTN